MSERGDDFLLVGTIVAPFGIRGEVKVFSATDRPEHLRRIKQLYMGSEHRPMALRRVVVHKQGVLVLGFNGIQTRDEAEQLRGQELYIAQAEAAPLEEDEYYLHQLPGMRVVTVAGEELGHVAEVLETGANEVLIVRAEEREVLVPMIKAVVKRLDFEAGCIEIDPLPGML